jgi:hypothetical protein
LKRDALLAEYQAQAFVADVVDHPLSLRTRPALDRLLRVERWIEAKVFAALKGGGMIRQPNPPLVDINFGNNVANPASNG